MFMNMLSGEELAHDHCCNLEKSVYYLGTRKHRKFVILMSKK